jgi:hypothetical protein
VALPASSQVRRKHHLQPAQCWRHHAATSLLPSRLGGRGSSKGGGAKEEGRAACPKGCWAARQEQARVDAVGPGEAEGGHHLSAHGLQLQATRVTCAPGPPASPPLPRLLRLLHGCCGGAAGPGLKLVDHLVDQQYSQAVLVCVLPAPHA